VAALDGLFNREVDLATDSEFAFANEILSGRGIRTIGSISRSSIESLVARKDRGINTLSDLKGKTIGVPLGSRPEFALDRYLFFQNIDPSSVTLVNVPVNKSVDALVNGEVDAVAAWQPYIDRMIDQMGDGVVVWDVQEDQPSYTLVMCMEKWISDNPELADRFLKALVKAEDYLIKNPDEAKTLIQQKLNYDDVYMTSVWPDYNFSVILDQTLVITLEDQARWIISNNPSSEKQTPNFVIYISTNALKAIKPGAVNIIR
jgi:ABC-type nitrate/sulfonate/bicarbonate transport system substrate-binding protein